MSSSRGSCSADVRGEELLAQATRRFAAPNRDGLAGRKGGGDLQVIIRLGGTAGVVDDPGTLLSLEAGTLLAVFHRRDHFDADLPIALSKRGHGEESLGLIQRFATNPPAFVGNQGRHFRNGCASHDDLARLARPTAQAVGSDRDLAATR